ncbi:MAG TPA: LysM peptidoglycan-binding domain-containing M23 family metallopeptidase [Pseudolabrys sp.]|uniref:LysM peptidoglycan-binding domain-containing M23 family metallopeptidase n=1 Tax=Pseudolabrys sp. TaxID=1960880 RepID=UPI002DDCF6F2|nr:LysM peptidoglycan-binding domain-containing M23 family metallopeptidase [Pseudolabrys sp.]HEV2627303.1 LysM peptidoglycan-binding domain-containing M23 family metallopeptidase [Pseudolabrys sp.]
MPRLTVPSRSRHWPRFAILAVVGVTAAGCADSGRFTTSSNRTPPADVTGSISSRPSGHVQAQTLPPPTPVRPYSVPAGVSGGAGGLAAYRPAQQRAPEYTGSVPVAHEAAKAAGHWTWNGGMPVVVGRGDTIDSVARRYGVPALAILQTNGIREGVAIHAGQRLVIPRYVVGAGPSEAPRNQVARVEPPRIAAPRIEPQRVAEAPRAQASGDIHVVQPGESLIGIARRHGLTLAEIARANHMQVTTKVSIGDRITIPVRGQPRVAERQVPVQQSAPRMQTARVERPRGAPPVENVGSVPVENARVATPEPAPAAAAENPVKKAEAVAANKMPQFRWPVTGHIIEAFGSRPNGTTNDGINLAVPEGTPIKAAEDGVVAYAGNELKGYGNLVLIRHADNFVSAYANASELLVKRGDTVKRGQVIARAGQTGNVSSPQLHFEIRKGSTPVDPRKYLASN